MKEKTKDIWYGIFKFIILVCSIYFLFQMFAVITLFSWNVLEIPFNSWDFVFEFLIFWVFIIFILSIMPKDYLKRKKQKGGKK